ncbi:MAG TPA: hypothetical protein VGG08_02130 [Solirubrobacteraceae bacterium]
MSTSERHFTPAASGRVRRVLVVAGCGVLTVTATACESTEQESAKLGRESSAANAGKTVKFGAVDRSVEVSDVTLLAGTGTGAVAARLRSTSSSAAVGLPLDLEITDAGGKLLYTNQTAGLEVALQQLSLLPAHGSVWWVDDQVPALPKSSHVELRVGKPKPGAKGASRALSTAGVKRAVQSGVGVVEGRVKGNSSNGADVFVVALKAGRPIAAGRATVAKLRGSETFEAFLAGKAGSAAIHVDALPSVQ